VKLHLPVLQRFDCQGCTHCCRRGWPIPVTDEERARIEKQGWRGTLDVDHFFEPYPAGGDRFPHMLAFNENGACVFLDESGKCRIHGQFGAREKPLACQLYPFVVTPAESGGAISVRYDCPSAAENRGRSLHQQRGSLESMASAASDEWRFDPPFVARTQRLEWSELRQIAEAADALLADDTHSPWQRVAAAARLCELLGEVSFEKIHGAKLHELLALLSPVAESECDALLADGRPQPRRRAIKMFRALLFAYGWSGESPAPRLVTRFVQRWRHLRISRRFARAAGEIPRLQGDWPHAAFEAVDRTMPPADEESVEPVIRSLRVKLDTLSFCGPGYFHYPLIDGLAALLLTYAVVGWFAKLSAFGGGASAPRREDVIWALRLVDHGYGRSPIFGKYSERLRITGLLISNDLAPLIGRHGA
jgi:lysine-N-methylase